MLVRMPSFLIFFFTLPSKNEKKKVLIIRYYIGKKVTKVDKLF